jgi:serine/threonine protein kinase
VLHDVGSQDGIDYLVMECVEGETLAKRLEKGPLPLEQVLKYGMQIAGALDRAHRSGVVHRDLKPGNIMLTTTGAKLLDFGLAKPASPLASAATLTATAVKQSPATEQAGLPTVLFQTHRRQPVSAQDFFSYDVSGDGQKFLIATRVDEANSAPLTVLLNWTSEMEK